MHYDPLKITNIFQSTSVHHLFAKMWAITQGKLLGTLEWKRLIGCGLMDHNNYLIRNVGFMSRFMTKYVDHMYWNNALDIKVQLPFLNPHNFLL
jgi:hypothetical protein